MTLAMSILVNKFAPITTCALPEANEILSETNCSVSPTCSGNEIFKSPLTSCKIKSPSIVFVFVCWRKKSVKLIDRDCLV